MRVANEKMLSDFIDEKNKLVAEISQESERVKQL